nr:rho-related BTB domain-containing protein 3-like [Parasteatoda tepidariorum]
MLSEEINEYVFTWKIKNYSSCYQAKGEKIVSPSFTIEDIPYFQFCLWFYPKGDHLSKNNVCYYLNRKALGDTIQAVTISFSLEIVDEKCCVLKSFESKGTHNFRGWKEFFSIDVLEKEMSNWTKDVLTLRCRIKRDNRLKQKVSGTVACTIIEVDRFFVDWNVKIPNLRECSENIAFSISDLYNVEIVLNSMSEALTISIWLKEKISEAPNCLTFTISIFNKIGCVLASKRAMHMYKNVVPWKFPDFITKEVMKKCESSSSWYEFGLKCKVCISKNKASGFIEKFEFSTTCSFETIKDNPTSSMQSEFQNIFSSKKYSDVTIRCKNDEFSAHKFVLKVRSPVLAAMFDQDMLENKTGIVDMANIDGKILKSFLEFLYTDRVDKMDYYIAKNLILTADKYQVQSLVDKCSFFLKSSASIENVCEIIAIADMINCESLKFYALSFMELNAANILSTAAWTDLIEGNIKLATYILSKLSENVGKSAMKKS